MVLLIQTCPFVIWKEYFYFTFQYGSINTANAFKSFTELITFTFQYGSINTYTEKHSLNHPESSLHSNMVLLIRYFTRSLAFSELTFTFQYGSINTNQFGYMKDFTLHSNMVLLIHWCSFASQFYGFLYIPIWFY